MMLNARGFFRGAAGALTAALVSGGAFAAAVATADPSAIGPYAEHVALNAHLDAETGQIDASAAVFLAPESVGAPAGELFEVVFLLHPDLTIAAVDALSPETLAIEERRSVLRENAADNAEEASADAVSVDEEATSADSEDEEPEFAPREHRLKIRLLQPAASLDDLGILFKYSGPIRQDPSEGEAPGAIHNFSMRAHIGMEGVYLSPEGYWYPTPDEGEGSAPPATYEALLTVSPESFQLAASAELSEDAAAGLPGQGWRTPYPIQGFVVVGGAHEVHQASYQGLGGNIDIYLHLEPHQAAHADGLFAALQRNFERYEPLIGPYPAREYRVVSNFFSSGFAFPCFTLLSAVVIDMGERAQTSHGYIDHEMLHCWWGNGVFVDPADGNWCEALASYGANYYGFVLDGDLTGARRTRRNYVHQLSDIPAEHDLPLNTFGQEKGAGRDIGYSKGAMVFHMLALQVGQETFWRAIRLFDERYLGKFAGWDEIQSSFEEASGQDLDWFFLRWVAQAGAPALEVKGNSAFYDPKTRLLSFALVKKDKPLGVALPVRVIGVGGASVSFDAAMTHNQYMKKLYKDLPPGRAVEHRTLPGVEPFYLDLGERIDAGDIPADFLPEFLEIDPNYDLFRKVGADEILPTTSATRSCDKLATVAPAGDLHPEYETLRQDYADGAEDHFGMAAGLVPDNELETRCVLILGEAVRDPKVAEFLKGMEFPVAWEGASGFAFQGVAYDQPNQAVLATARHPKISEGGVTVFYGNSPDGIPPARLMSFYPNSIVIFEDGKASVRHDTEIRRPIPVQMIR